MENKDQPIHPIVSNEGYVSLLNQISGTKNGKPNTAIGLTKREEFAKAAMQGLLAATDNKGLTRNGILAIAEESVLMADELLKALEK